MASFTQIYASWDCQANRVTCRIGENALKRYFIPYMHLFLNFNGKLRPLELRDLEFGINSLRHMEIIDIRLKDGAKNWILFIQGIEVFIPRIFWGSDAEGRAKSIRECRLFDGRSKPNEISTSYFMGACIIF